MQTILGILHSEAALIVAIYLANSIASLVVGKLPRQGRAWKVLRLIHGILDKVDPTDPKS